MWVKKLMLCTHSTWHFAVGVHFTSLLLKHLLLLMLAAIAKICTLLCSVMDCSGRAVMQASHSYILS
jgi:hypothetical protein